MNTQSNDPVRIMAFIMANMPMILMRSGFAWLSFKKQAQKGAKTFQKELVNQGLDKETAKLFTKDYVESSNLVKLFMNQS
jgi:hypothetical protein